MKHEKLAQSLDEVRDDYIADAAGLKRKLRLRPWLGAVAAILVVAILVGVLWPRGASPTGSLQDPAAAATVFPTAPIFEQLPASHYEYALATPMYPQLCGYPLEQGRGDYDAWLEDQRAIHNQPEHYADPLQDYFAGTAALLLSETGGKNAACSPVNIYMALAMLAEVTGGESRQELLALLNAPSLEALREQAGHVWRGHYNNDGLTTSILASSLWLDEEYTHDPETAGLLAEHYYASVYSGDLGSTEMNQALRDWLNEQTGNLLQHQSEGMELDPRTAVALASTIFYTAAWADEFRKEANTEALFHGTAGDTTEVFMNRYLTYGTYYWDDGFGAVALPLKDGSRMWLMLPDEGLTPEALMQSGELFAFLDSASKNSKSLSIELSMPKFDISAETDLVKQLKTMGVTQVFDRALADFSPILPGTNDVAVSKISHAARVTVDEEGIWAAAYTVIEAPGAGMPPEEEMRFVLDRPFAFVIESEDGLPLFAGIVNEP